MDIKCSQKLGYFQLKTRYNTAENGNKTEPEMGNKKTESKQGKHAHFVQVQRALKCSKFR